MVNHIFLTDTGTYCFRFLLQHYQEDQEFTDILMFMNIGFTILYMIEAGLKFIALRLVRFFLSYIYSR